MDGNHNEFVEGLGNINKPFADLEMANEFRAPLPAGSYRQSFTGGR